MTTKDRKKFKELVLYMSQKSDGDTKFGMVKLNKLLFFADAARYVNTGHSITGATYMKEKHGPVPKCMKPMMDEMQADKEFFVRPVPTVYSNPRNVPTALRNPKLDVFSAEEISLVDDILETFKPFNGTEVREISHRMVGWDNLPENGMEIPLGTILYPEKVTLNDNDISFFRGVIAEKGW